VALASSEAVPDTERLLLFPTKLLAVPPVAAPPAPPALEPTPLAPAPPIAVAVMPRLPLMAIEKGAAAVLLNTLT
jgi:hypothetical protein